MGKIVADDHTSYAVAVEFCNAARVYLDHLANLYPKEILNIHVGMPVNFLIAHSLENLLKGYCYLGGLKKDDLMKYDLRHNLNNLLIEVENIKFILSDELRELVEAISPLHQDHRTRYLEYNRGIGEIDQVKSIDVLSTEISKFQALRINKARFKKALKSNSQRNIDQKNLSAGDQ